MKVELSEQDIINTVEFLNRAPLKGSESFTMAMLIQTYRVAMQPTKEEEETPVADLDVNGATPKAQAKEKAK